MSWTVSFDYDPALDLAVVRYRDVLLTTQTDVVRWRDAVAAHLERHGRRVDVLIGLDGLFVRPQTLRLYGEHRAEMIRRYCQRTYRFGGDSPTRTSVYITAAVENAHANVHATYEEALAALLADRARAH